MSENYRYIFVKVNQSNITLTLDQTTYDELTANPHELLPGYMNTLQKNNIISTDQVKFLAFSLDNDTYDTILDNEDDTYDTIFDNESNKSPSVVNEGDIEDNVPVEQETLWSEAATKLLLDKYHTYLPLVGPLKKFRKKKNLWEQISNDLQRILNISKTAIQVENRYKTVLKRKKKIVDHNKHTGETQVEDVYEQEFAKISSIDDSIEPEVQLGVGKCVMKAHCSTPSTSSDDSGKVSNINKRKRSLHDIMLDIAEKREEGREKRHKEKMELLMKMSENFIEKLQK